MKSKVVAPSVGESITEVRVLAWKKAAGDTVKPGDVLVELETDKATVEVAAETAGAVEIVRQAGETVPVGDLLGYVDDSVQGKAGASTPSAASKPNLPPPPSAAATAAPMMHASGGAMDTMGPAARKMASEMNIDPSKIQGTGKDGRVTKGDLLNPIPMGAGAVSAGTPAPARAPTPTAPKMADKAGDRRVPMTMIRQRIAQRLLEAQNSAAILTTFNEVDMTNVMKIRNAHKDAFKAKYGAPLSFMSFFSRACVLALKQIPSVNAFIDGNDIVYHDYVDMGIAVGTERGLVVPVIRGVDKMTFMDMEKNLGALAEKARTNKLSISEMTGGTFTITNGGTYGSLLSTPILNTPQSGILGMHNIVQRPVAIDGKVEIRPMMYLALSYDHRIIDGKEAVTFLIAVRDALQAPEKLGMEFLNA